MPPVAPGGRRVAWGAREWLALELVEVLDGNGLRQIPSDWPSGLSIEVGRCTGCGGEIARAADTNGDGYSTDFAASLLTFVRTGGPREVSLRAMQREVPARRRQGRRRDGSTEVSQVRIPHRGSRRRHERKAVRRAGLRHGQNDSRAGSSGGFGWAGPRRLLSGGSRGFRGFGRAAAGCSSKSTPDALEG